MLVHLPSVLPAEQCIAMRAALDSAEWIDGRATVGPRGAQVKDNQQLADGSTLAQVLGDQVLQALQQHPLYHAAALPLRTLPPRFNRYRGGGNYGLHVDGAVMTARSPQQPAVQLRSDISCTLFLEDPANYDGGELIVSDTYGEHEVKLDAGDAILYPSSSLHRVTPVTRGARLACFFWIQSMVRDQSRRRTLLELDTAIQTLNLQSADSDALLRLTGVYHNLLREWADV